MATKSKTSKILFLSSALFMNGFIHLQIILSHAYMPRITHDTIDNIGWVRCQAITAVNIETKWYDDWFHGGLQYQFDHHIFPRIPRHNLCLIKPHILELCQKHKISYNSEYFYDAIIKMLNSMYIEARMIT